MKTKFNKKQKKIIKYTLIGLIVYVFGMIILHFLPIEKNDTIYKILNFILALGASIIMGHDLIRKVSKTITKGQIFDENFLMLLAVFGALCTRQYNESVEVLLFFQIGDLFESYSVSSSRNAIQSLVEMVPEEATVVRNGKEEVVSPDEIEIGETIIIRPGEKIPVDSIVTKGNSAIDTSALTGESIPTDVAPGDSVLSGSINMSGLLEIKSQKEFGDSTASKILELVENASDNKSEAEGFVARFAKYYTPIVVFLAIAVAFIPPIITLIAGGGNVFIEWIKRALIFLVVSCPCAIVISVPLAFFGSIGGASKSGILIKGSNFVEKLAKAEAVVMDKTGTLTEGKFSVTEISPANGFTKDQLLKYAALSEKYSNHPIALSLRNAFAEGGNDIENEKSEDVKEIAGFGVSAVIDGKEILCGKYDLMKNNSIEASESDFAGTVVYVSVDGKYAGYIGISDKIKSDSKEAVSGMRKLGVKVLAMLTGDSDKIGKHVADELKLDRVYSKLLPEDKVIKLKEVKEEIGEKGTVAFAGDGMNDAPVLTAADVGIAMGALGSDAAIEAADVVIMDDKPSRIPEAISISQKCMRIVYFNVTFALIVKITILVLATLGKANMLMGIFGDTGVSIICILISMLTLRKIKDRPEKASSVKKKEPAIA